jgi:hypothetical protein
MRSRYDASSAKRERKELPRAGSCTPDGKSSSSSSSTGAAAFLASFGLVGGATGAGGALSISISSSSSSSFAAGRLY